MEEQNDQPAPPVGRSDTEPDSDSGPGPDLSTLAGEAAATWAAYLTETKPLHSAVRLLAHDEAITLLRIRLRELATDGIAVSGPGQT